MDENGLERVTVAARTFETLLSRMREVVLLRERVHRAEDEDLRRCARLYGAASNFENSRRIDDV